MGSDQVVTRSKGSSLSRRGNERGICGLKRGYRMMIGDDADTVRRLDPILIALAAGIGTAPRTPGRGGTDRYRAIAWPLGNGRPPEGIVHGMHCPGA